MRIASIEGVIDANGVSEKSSGPSQKPSAALRIAPMKYISSNWNSVYREDLDSLRIISRGLRLPGADPGGIQPNPGPRAAVRLKGFDMRARWGAISKRCR